MLSGDHASPSELSAQFHQQVNQIGESTQSLYSVVGGMCGVGQLP